jgi:lipoprotein-anchoring transpeptidase ErfK/SrfK
MSGEGVPRRRGATIWVAGVALFLVAGAAQAGPDVASVGGVGAVKIALAEGAAKAAADPEAPPALTARIDLSAQTMSVYLEDRLEYVFKTSTARKGYLTPLGRYQPEWLSRDHRSRKYDNAPMPWAVFFHEGWAVHGTTELRQLGRPASHGCVRLHPDNARIFFSLVREIGQQNTLISIVQ